MTPKSRKRPKLRLEFSLPSWRFGFGKIIARTALVVAECCMPAFVGKNVQLLDGAAFRGFDGGSP